MKREISLPEEKNLKPIPYPKGFEKKFERLMTEMTKAMVQQYRNETFKKLNKGSIEKFEDAQVGNWATVFSTLSNRAKKKIRKRFNNDRIKKTVSKLLMSLNKSNQDVMYNEVENVVGISAKELVASEGLKANTNALIQETLEWVGRNQEETLVDFSANSLRLMGSGEDFDKVLSGFNQVAEKRVQSASFVARNQLANFNSMSTKIKAENLGITHATWVTAKDERVRPSHVAREGVEFALNEGLYSSVDGKILLPGTDFNCRCTYKMIIPGDDDDE
jgi:SPP1 gp7 family putative phage head morphogenesis protein